VRSRDYAPKNAVSQLLPHSHILSPDNMKSKPTFLPKIKMDWENIKLCGIDNYITSKPFLQGLCKGQAKNGAVGIFGYNFE